jgi:beta-galactosidase
MMYPKNFIAYGAQYYRAPTPFSRNWENDLKAAADAGFNTMKFWVQWRVNSTGPNKYDFSDIERLMDIAAKNNMKAILGPVFDGAPTWFETKYPDSWMITSTGRVMYPQTLSYRQIGGSPGPCLNHPAAREKRTVFMQAMAERFSKHPALLLWDVWNEPELTNGILRTPIPENLLCYCDHCRNEFIKWLKDKYCDIVSLNNAWHGAFGSFDEMNMPRGIGVPKPMVDFRMFFTDVCANEVRLRRDAVRNTGDEHPVMVHTVPMPYFNIITTGSDDYKLAKECDMFGCSIGSEPFASAVTVSAAPNKKTIASEIHAMGGSTYVRPDKATFEAFKRHVFVPLAKGMKGFQYWQMRPEVLGNEAPAWGLLDLRGRTTTPQFSYVKQINDALQANVSILSEAMPEKAQVAVLNNGKNQIFDWVASGTIDIHYNSVKGIFDALYSRNYNVDILSEQQMIEQPLDQYKFIVAPFPYYMEKELADSLRNWVAKGGHLLSEVFFGGVSDETGCFEEMQPGYGFDEVFGAEESIAYSVGLFKDAYSEKWDVAQLNEYRIPLNFVNGKNSATGFHFIQGFETKEGAEVLATFEDGTPAVVRNRYGEGMATIVGTLLGCFGTDANAEFISQLAEAANVPQTALTDSALRVDKLHHNGECVFVIVSNNTNCDEVAFVVEGLSRQKMVNIITREASVSDENGSVRVKVKPGDMEMFRVEKTGSPKKSS